MQCNVEMKSILFNLNEIGGVKYDYSIQLANLKPQLISEVKYGNVGNIQCQYPQQ